MHGGRTEAEAPGRERATWAARAALTLGAALVALLTLGLVIGLEGRDRFWLDEAWTGAVVSRSSWADTFHQIYWDVNAPLYYLLLKVWSGVAGLSDAALRAPSVACAVAIPLVASLAPMPGLTRMQRWAWGGTIALWFPALCFAQEARCYALLLLVAVAQTWAYVRLCQRPTPARAWAWTGFAALAILVHYDAVYLGAAQGVLYLARHRRRAVRTWPAALAFAPAFGWMAFHWPTIRAFARPDLAWYSTLRIGELRPIAGYLAGAGPQLELFGALALSALSLRLVLPPARRSDAEPVVGWRGAAWLAVAAAALAAALLVGVGFVRPSFTFRYLTPEAPGLMLGVVLVASLLVGRRAAPVTLAATIIAVAAASAWMLAHHLRMAPRRYSFETASAAIMEGRPGHLAFLWDHPIDPVLHPEQLQALGGFFLQRAGAPVPVSAVVLRPGEDPNAALVQAAGGRGGAILWLYDTAVRGTAAATHAPRIEVLDPAFRCRNYGSGRFGVVACVQPPAT